MPSNRALQLLGLALAGALFCLLFGGFAVVQGVGEPGIARGDVAVVTGMPGDEGNISKAEFGKALVQAANREGLKQRPGPGDPIYGKLRTVAMEQVLDGAWTLGEGAEMGIAVTKVQIAAALEQIKRQNFKSDAAFRKFLEESRLTKEDVDRRVELQIISGKIQQRLEGISATPSRAEIEDYYAAGKASQFTRPSTRDVRSIANKDAAKLGEAKAALERDSSAKSWRRLAKRYSENPLTRSAGGLQTGLAQGSGSYPPALEEAIFAAPVGTIEGPIEAAGSGLVFQVERARPERVRPLSEVESLIRMQLVQQARQQAYAAFVFDYETKWSSRTYCAAGYVIDRCTNYVGSGHPPTALPGCYEASPKGDRPEECPAPVVQSSPALPGTVTLVAPRGKRLPQHPFPEVLGEGTT